MNQVLAYLPNVIAALLIFLIAAAIAAAVGGLVHRTMGDTPTGRVARSAAPTLVMAIAVFMILNQLGIATVIVTATYIALIGAVALGSALAFGLGGRDAAADLINSGYRKAQEQSDQVRADLAVGRQRAEADARAYAPTNGGAGNGGPGNGAPTTGAPTGGDVPQGRTVTMQPAAPQGVHGGDPYADPAAPPAPSSAPTPPQGNPVPGNIR
jgi:hypothetical protein